VPQPRHVRTFFPEARYGAPFFLFATPPFQPCNSTIWWRLPPAPDMHHICPARDGRPKSVPAADNAAPAHNFATAAEFYGQYITRFSLCVGARLAKKMRMGRELMQRTPAQGRAVQRYARWVPQEHLRATEA